jgi:hypothetical protein
MNAPRFLAALGKRPFSWLFGLFLPLLVQQLHYRGSPFSQILPFDTQLTYLPLARRFLEDASGLFSDPAHLVVAPGSFIYLALFGADSEIAVQANLVFGGLLLLLAFDALRRLAGFAAAAAVAWLIALSPLLPEVMILPLSEPPQLLCLGVWLWSCALICEAPQRRWPVVLGGVALLLSILTRATYVYWIVAAAGACALLIWRGGPQLRSIASRLLMLHLIAGAGTAAYIGYNKATFDFPMVATGSGAALYFGVNPATAGYEPPYYGLLHDHFQVMGGIESHLSLEGDRRLSQLAKAALLDMPVTALADMLVQKAGATLFFSQADLDRKVFNARAWHVLLIVLAVFGLWRYRRQPYLWMLGCIVAYQVAIMTLAMHGTRYAIGAVELPLTLLAAFGVAAIWQARSRTRAVAAFAVILLLGVTIGYLHQRYSRPLMPDLTHVPYRTLATAEPDRLKWQGLDGDPFSAQGALSTEKDTYIVWENLSLSQPTGIPIVRFQAQDFDKACKEVRLDYFRPDGQLRSTRLFLNRMRPPQTISIGTLPLDALEPLGGTLRIAMRCPLGTRLQFENLEIDSIDRGSHYLQQIEQAARNGD